MAGSASLVKSKRLQTKPKKKKQKKEMTKLTSLSDAIAICE